MWGWDNNTVVLSINSNNARCYKNKHISIYMKNVWDKSPVTLNHFKPLQFSVGISSSKKGWTWLSKAKN